MGKNATTKTLSSFSREKGEAKVSALFLLNSASNENHQGNNNEQICTKWTNKHNILNPELKLWPHLPLSLWSAARPASQSARGTASTGRCHLSGERPPRRCSLTAWPGWCLCTVLWRLPAPDQPAGPRSSWRRPGGTGQIRELFNEDPGNLWWWSQWSDRWIS